jgi:hypothetical protein
MELKDFIEKSIHDITSAIHSSSEKMLSDKTGKGIPDHNEINLSFDIAVSAGDTTESSGNASIKVLNSIGLGGSSKSGKEIQEVNRLSFVVPVKVKTIGSKGFSVV